MTYAIPQYEKYFQMGRRAFLDGKKCIPAHDPEYIRELGKDWPSARIGDATSGDRDQAVNAWLGGWTLENIKNPGATR